MKIKIFYEATSDTGLKSLEDCVNTFLQENKIVWSIKYVSEPALDPDGAPVLYAIVQYD